MRRIRNKKTGEVFDSICQAIYTVHCYENRQDIDSKCSLACPLWKVCSCCTDYVVQHQEEAAELFGYEFID